MVETGDAPAKIVKDKGLEQVTDTGALEAWCDEAIAANAQAVEAFKGGNAGAINRILGAVMKSSKGSANPAQVREILEKKLG